jgi:S-adenosylmethionine:tRNA ribosyltransferase-isomerase
MQLSDFDFTLPDELIATKPVEPRDASRLLYVPAGGEPFVDAHVYQLADYLQPHDIVVVNNTKVIPA